MRRHKIFSHKTKRGGVLKIVREHYLRDDIACGADTCTPCNALLADDESFSRPSLLSVSEKLIHNKFFAKNHFIVPDTNVVLHQVFVD